MISITLCISGVILLVKNATFNSNGHWRATGVIVGLIGLAGIAGTAAVAIGAWKRKRREREILHRDRGWERIAETGHPGESHAGNRAKGSDIVLSDIASRDKRAQQPVSDELRFSMPPKAFFPPQPTRQAPKQESLTPEISISSANAEFAAGSVHNPGRAVTTDDVATLLEVGPDMGSDEEEDRNIRREKGRKKEKRWSDAAEE